MGVLGELDERANEFLLGLVLEIDLILLELEGSFLPLDVECHVGGLESGAVVLGVEPAIKHLDDLGRQSVADLFGDDLGRARLALAPLAAAGTADLPLLHKL